MKVLFLISSLKNGGPVNMLYTLAKYLDSSKCEKIVVAIKPSPENKTRDFSDIDCRLITLSKGSLSELQKIVDAEKPDIIHSHGGVADSYCVRLKGGFKHFSTIHCVPDEEFPMKLGKLKGWMKATMFTHTLKKIQYPIACSETVSNKILRDRHVQLSYIRNGIDIQKADQAKSDVAKTDLKISENDLVFIFCGYLSLRKNAAYIINAIRKCERKDMKLLVLGDGEKMEELKTLAAEDKRIIFLGRQSNPYAYYRISDYFISASLSEGLPLAVMEAMSCGLPAVLSDIESHREIKSCFAESVRLFSLSDLAELIQMIDSSKKPQAEDCLKIKNFITDQLSAERMAQEYLEKYKSAVEK